MKELAKFLRAVSKGHGEIKIVQESSGFVRITGILYGKPVSFLIQNKKWRAL